MDNKKDTMLIGIHGGSINKNGRVYNFDTVQEALRNSNIEKFQLSSMYGMFGKENKEIKVSRLEDLDYHNGFKSGYLYCLQRQLEGSLCEKCESREQCIRDKENEVDRIKNIISIDIDNSPDISTINIINASSIPIGDITSMRRKENGD